ncbi:leucine--tRNA ligase, putative, partial [Plasmodium ovale curtisi]
HLRDVTNNIHRVIIYGSDENKIDYKNESNITLSKMRSISLNIKKNSIEKNIQNLWKEHNIYEKEIGDINETRFTGNFPYPYMNGLLHIGHAFTLSKLEFSIRFKNMTCDHVLLPFSFHCTGTPIVVCADKLKNELKNRVLNDKTEEKHECQLKENALEEKSGEISEKKNVEKNVDATVFRSNKSKAQSKGGVQNTQYDIMKQMNISDDKIHLFQDPEYWCYYFSSQAKTHLEAFGLYCDWRRSFITTNINPYYNKFVNWQFNSLYKKNLIYYGSRITIFSRVNNQACADHERSEGEGVKCQEYTLIKIYLENYNEFFNIFIESVLNCNTEKSSSSNSVKYTPFSESEEDLKNKIWTEEFLKKKNIIFLGSTLKPETIYGQNYAFVNPDDYYCVTFGFDKQMLNYGDKNYVNNIMTKNEIIEKCENIYICSENSLYNLAYQGIIPMLKKKEKKEKNIESNNKGGSKNMFLNNIEDDLFILAKIKGEKFVGLKVYTNISKVKDMYILPMTTIKMNTATGVVPCVSSDSTDDYACLEDIKRKKKYYCEKYNLLKEEYLNNESVSCIEIPGIGTHTGKHFYETEKITSYKDAKLQKLKGMLYKKQYFEGIMKIEPYNDMKTFNCRKLVKQNIIKNNDGFLYSEPEVLVIDRNNVKCIAALCNQWYINYGNLDFKKDVLIQLKKNNFQTYNDVLYKQLQHVIFWLDDWSCSRAYGLGTHMPDFKEANKSENEKGEEEEEGTVKKTELIESLSDSTIYMAYYTISHYLQGNVDGKEKGTLDIDHKDLNDAFFDYVFDISNNTTNISKNISIEKLNTMRKSFKYWYPFDIRISGKDLIFNHLTMSLFNHVAIWGQKVYKKNKDCLEEKSALDRQTEILNEVDKLDLNQCESKVFHGNFYIKKKEKIHYLTKFSCNIGTCEFNIKMKLKDNILEKMVQAYYEMNSNDFSNNINNEGVVNNKLFYMDYDNSYYVLTNNHEKPFSQRVTLMLDIEEKYVNKNEKCHAFGNLRSVHRFSIPFQFKYSDLINSRTYNLKKITNNKYSKSFNSIYSELQNNTSLQSEILNYESIINEKNSNYEYKNIYAKTTHRVHVWFLMFDDCYDNFIRNLKLNIKTKIAYWEYLLYASERKDISHLSALQSNDKNRDNYNDDDDYDDDTKYYKTYNFDKNTLLEDPKRLLFIESSFTQGEREDISFFLKYYDFKKMKNFTNMYNNLFKNGFYEQVIDYIYENEGFNIEYE